MQQPPIFNQDPAAADWVAAALTGAWGHVTGVVPAGYPAYARILHPVDDGRFLHRWSEIARELGTSTHPLVQWLSLLERPVGATDGTWRGSSPEEGNLPHPTSDLLVSVLADHTSTAEDCWFLVWDGYGWIDGSPVARTDAPHTEPAANYGVERDPVRLPGRNYLIGRGPLAAVDTIGRQIEPDWFVPQFPNLAWPQDRAWCTATEIDFDSTLVAGSRHLIDELLAHAGLEAWQVGPNDSLQHDADHVNPNTRRTH